ncbi:hypothetical protein AB0M02_37145 [Actinoplanes sp. NPDC051861]|uniref:hypothetical protein n=1 Tax=Actinoplanes sp. NPDC051861 TaxID=3155170 RepID=UPI003435A04A
MRLRPFLRRVTVSAVAAGLALTWPALPARADEPLLDTPFVAVLAPETVTVIDGRSKTVKVEVVNIGGAAEDVVLRFGDEKHPVPADLGFTAPDGCSGATCAIGALKAGERRALRFTVKPAGTSPAAELALTTVVGGVVNFTTSAAIVRTAKGGADLEMGDIKNLKLGRGDTADVPFVVRNTGNEAVKAVGLVVLSGHGAVTPLLDYRNCDTDEDFGGVVCVFNEPLAAGGSFALPEATPLRVRVAPDAAGPFEYPVIAAAVGLTDRYVFDFAARTAGAKGSALKLQALATTAAAAEPDAVPDLNEDDNFTDFTVAVPRSAADSAAVGGSFRGAVGERATARVGARNLGPTGMVPPSLDNLPYVRVRIPAGIELTSIDERCVPGTSPYDVLDGDIGAPAGREYVCILFSELAKGGQELFAFTGEILDGEHGGGKVTVDGGVQDDRSGNDTAAVTVEVAAGGAGGGLPITGAPAGLVAGVGAMLLGLGALAYRMARRRRIVTVVE